MSKLLEALGTIPPVVRELDLTELDSAYVDGGGESLKLQYRVNWTRAQKKRRWELSLELEKIGEELAALGADAKPEKKEAAEKRLEANSRAWLEWWSGILLLEVEEVDGLRETGFLWEWLTSAVIKRVVDYEGDAIKKALGLPSVMPEASPASPPKSQNGQSSPDS